MSNPLNFDGDSDGDDIVGTMAPPEIKDVCATCRPIIQEFAAQDPDNWRVYSICFRCENHYLKQPCVLYCTYCSRFTKRCALCFDYHNEYSGDQNPFDTVLTYEIRQGLEKMDAKIQIKIVQYLLKKWDLYKSGVLTVLQLRAEVVSKMGAVTAEMPNQPN